MPRPTLRDSHPNNTALTNISIGYRNGMYLFRDVFPVVTVDKKSDFFFVFDKHAWFKSKSGQRAPGTRPPRADYSLSTGSYLCINDSIATTVTKETLDNADQPLRPLITATNYVSDQLELGAEIRVANVVTASANWAYASSPATQWSSDTSDPWGDIDTLIHNVVTQIGRAPNVAVMSWGIWRHLRQHPDFLDRVKYTRPSGRIETDDLKGWFNFDKVLVGTAIRDTALEGQSASQNYVWGSTFWAGYVPDAAALETPAAGYTLVWKENNRPINRFYEEQERQWVVDSEWYTAEKITASDAGGCIPSAA